MIINSEVEQMLLDAVNAEATQNEAIMDLGEARAILAKAINTQTKWTTDGDSFTDWAFWEGAWNTCKTFDEAWDQIVTIAEQWDELCAEEEN